MGTHSRAGVEKRLGGRNPKDYHVNGISMRGTMRETVQVMKAKALLAGGTGCRLEAEIDV